MFHKTVLLNDMCYRHQGSEVVVSLIVGAYQDEGGLDGRNVWSENCSLAASDNQQIEETLAGDDTSSGRYLDS